MMPLNRMALSVFISVFLLGAVDLYAAEQPELVEQKPQYIRTRELPTLKISFADMQSILEKAANLLSDANAKPPKAKPKEFFFRETLRLGMACMITAGAVNIFWAKRSLKIRPDLRVFLVTDSVNLF